MRAICCVLLTLVGFAVAIYPGPASFAEQHPRVVLQSCIVGHGARRWMGKSVIHPSVIIG